jgi:hypothetical protein
VQVNLEHANPELFAALSQAQGEIENATKSSTNPHFRSRYADLAEVLNTVRPVLSKHGLAVMQSTEANGEMVSVTTAIVHKDGGYVTSTASCVPAKWDGQGVGAATTYLRRYSLAAMCSIAQEDDDGQSAAHNNKPAQKPAGPPSREFSLLVDAIQSCASLDALRDLYDQAKNLAENECAEARNMARARKAKLEKEHSK